MKEVREQQQQQGMYRPEFEHDNCGIGAVVNIKGKKTHDTVANALKIVEHLERCPDRLYQRLHTCKYAGGTGDRNWTDDGQLPWGGESSGAGISLPYRSQCDQSCAGLYIPQIYSAGNYRCILINCSWFPVCNGNFCALYPL